jgi:hypothetical protein
MTEPTTPSAWGIQLSKLWMECGQPFPVDVKQLALEVTKTKFPDPISVIKPHGISGIDGMLSKRKLKGGWCISYDETVTIPGRINFTLGHEFGHYLMHRQTREEFRCGQADMLDYNSAASKKMESEANKFASFLLMPANDFREQVKGQAITIDLLGHCAMRYGASFTATALKWLEITDEAAILVVARDEFVCWSYPSQLASRKGAYLPPGTPVPQSAIDRLRGATAPSRNKWCRVQPGVWHPAMEAEEAAIVSDQFDLAIFLIRFSTTGTIEHEEEPEQDAFSFLTERARGFREESQKTGRSLR